MADYVLLYGGGKMPETKEEQDAVMAAWNAWFGEMGGAIKDRQPVLAGVKSIGSDGAVSDRGGPPAGTRSCRRLAGRGGGEGQGVSGITGRRHITVYETFEVM